MIHFNMVCKILFKMVVVEMIHMGVVVDIEEIQDQEVERDKYQQKICPQIFLMEVYLYFNFYIFYIYNNLLFK